MFDLLHPYTEVASFGFNMRTASFKLDEKGTTLKISDMHVKASGMRLAPAAAEEEEEVKVGEGAVAALVDIRLTSG